MIFSTAVGLKALTSGASCLKAGLFNPGLKYKIQIKLLGNLFDISLEIYFQKSH